jgi:hypothetical protein
MIDVSHLPRLQNGTIDYFPGFCNSTGTVWEVWEKPTGCTFIRILCIGGGGGGGDGATKVSGISTSSGGGGGGASGAMTTITIPAIFLPDRLYVSSGAGGAESGGNGVTSEVCIAPANVNIYILCYAEGGTGGGTGSVGVGAGGAGGTGGAQAVLTTANQGFRGDLNSIAGQDGGAGGAPVGGAITYPTTGLLLSGGSGGGGISANASSVAGNVNAPASQTTVYNLFQTLTAVAVSDGQAGVELYQPLMSCGGVGGSAVLNGGKSGGAGGFGSGGGGGGSSIVNGVPGGKGGKGGPGLVVIHAW